VVAAAAVLPLSRIAGAMLAPVGRANAGGG
jgi:hypothetical protein